MSEGEVFRRITLGPDNAKINGRRSWLLVSGYSPFN
jgi:hypothetical protein